METLDRYSYTSIYISKETKRKYEELRDFLQAQDKIMHARPGPGLIFRVAIDRFYNDIIGDTPTAQSDTSAVLEK
jgi:hypothetical protein